MKKLVWLLVILAAIAYGLVVYNWWLEGNANFERQRQEKQTQL